MTITAYKNRTIDPAVPVKVYRNLRTGGFSVKQAGRVVAHASSLYLTRATFKVSAAGRARVLKEKQKNVHAFVVGYLSEKPIEGLSRPVYYNPYKVDSFVHFDTFEPLHNAPAVALIDNKMFIE